MIKQFWKTVKPLFTVQTKFSEKITAVEGDKIFKWDAKDAELLNAFYSNLLKNLKIPEFDKVNSFAEEVSHPILKAISKT